MLGRLVIAMSAITLFAGATVGIAGPASAAEISPVAESVVTATTDVSAPTLGAPLVGTPLPASVSITSAPDHWKRYVPMPMSLATTGFSTGNWVNVWVTNPDGSRDSQDGHFMESTSPKAFANFVHGPGTYKVQVSVGKWPEEQWSQVISVRVGRDD